jgi:D-glycero-D-manno-heptose 1,7-bisphosphate phosphatase
MAALRPAVFLDRDGTLIEEAGYLDRLERLAFFPYSVDAVRLLNRAGYAVVVISNQSGVARGIVAPAFIREAHDHVAARLAAGGARVDAFYHCPHHPQAAVASLRVACDCRKPKPGLLRRAAEELALDPGRSFVVGDRWHDLEAGQALGIRGVLVRTGHGATEERAPKPGVEAAAVADNLAEAVAWILATD